MLGAPDVLAALLDAVGVPTTDNRSPDMLTSDERSRAHTAAADALTRYVDDDTTRRRMAARIVDSPRRLA